jgi:hypothetical protein
MKSLKQQKEAINQSQKLKAEHSIQKQIDLLGLSEEENKETTVELLVPYKKGEVIAAGAPKFMVEMMFGQMLVEMKRALDVYVGHMHQEDMKRIDVWRNVYIICVQESRDAVDLLKGRHDATLTFKHRVARKLLIYLQADLSELYEGMMDAKNQNKGEAKTFGVLITQFLGDFHQILHEEVPKATKNKIISKWGEGREETMSNP